MSRDAHACYYGLRVTRMGGAERPLELELGMAIDLTK
jgi:hypothetical protein